MKKFVGILAALLLIVSAWSFAPAAQASETGLFTIHSSALLARINTADEKRKELIQGKLDLNNSDVREFRRLRGFYPSLASKIIQNAPLQQCRGCTGYPWLKRYSNRTLAG